MTDPAPPGASSSTTIHRGRRLSVAFTVVLAVLLSLVPLAALEAVGASPAGASPTCPCSLWAPETLPAIVDFNDAAAVELGVQFSSTTSGYINGVRFYKAVANTGEHIGSLWTADGTLLAQATFTSESDSGWQQVNFADPVAVVANTLYVAGYHTNTGHYSVDQGYFSEHGHTNDPLSAPGGDSSTPNGLYAYSPTPTFPTGTFNGNNYWVDVSFTATPYPVSVSVSSVQGSLPKGTSQQLSAVETFSDGSTRDVTATAAWSSSNPAVGNVSASGAFSATAVGSTTVTAAIDAISGQTTINVLAPVSFIVVTPIISILAPTQTKQLTATARLTDGSTTNVTALVKWGSLFGSGATVSPSGLVKANRVGVSIFTASLGRSSGLASVVVLPRSPW